jgi:phosphatidylglycerol---prolipoprotein diacylglyceryl transferase
MNVGRGAVARDVLMQQILVRIPWINVPIFGFGAMLFVAFLTCTWLAGRRARREDIAPEHIQDLAIWLFVGGLLGARTLFLLIDAKPRPQGLADFLWQLPRIWDGGIILYGSIVGGLLGYVAFYWVSFRRHGIPTLKLADILAPSVALGIAIGRLGCFLNGCCYGQVACADCVVYPVHFPLSAPPRYALVHAGAQTAAGFTYAEPEDSSARMVKVGRVEKDSEADRAGLKPGDLIEKADGETLAGATDESPAERLNYHMTDGWERGRNVLTLTVLDPDGTNPHDITLAPRTIGLLPTQLFETISMVLLCLVLLALDPIRQRDGLMTSVLMMGYAVHRALNELLRADTRPDVFERLFSYFLFAAGLALFVYVLGWGRKVQSRVEDSPPAEQREAITAAASGSA